ncbi:MAG TPA: 50S ribosomal protein L11 [Thermoplasmata archaeon]|jgi:large subunit ribosomal protein L11|nr:50S ribosomal protein L11 [Thermoplasmata archaeon]
MPEKLEVLVDGGKATPGPPLGPALGPLGVNIVEILKAINEKTKSFEGMKVPVTLIVDPKSKAFTIEVGTPPTSALIAKELRVEKGSGDAGKTRVGNLTLPQAIRIAKMKADAMLAKSLKARVLEVVGTCVSMGVTVEGKPAKEFSKEIQAGKFDKQLAG